MAPPSARDRLVFPLDFPTLADARRAAEALAPAVGVLKVGLELFVREGPEAARVGERLGRDVFLDLKLHDIPETVERAVASAAALGVRYLTVHAGGGAAMLSRAAAQAAKAPRPLTLLAVTVLTSLDDTDLVALGVVDGVREHAVRVARLAWESGVRGFVTSPREARALRDALGPEALLVTPGIRPGGRGRRGPEAGGDAGERDRGRGGPAGGRQADPGCGRPEGGGRGGGARD